MSVRVMSLWQPAGPAVIGPVVIGPAAVGAAAGDRRPSDVGP